MRVDAAASSGPESIAFLMAADLEAEARVLNGEGAQSGVLATAERLVRLKRQLLGPNHLEVATSLLILGQALLADGEFERARQEFERAVRIIERADSSNLLRLADALHGLGDAEIRTEKYDAAEQTLNRALALREASLGPASRPVALTLERQGYLRLQSGKYREARPPLERALHIAESGAPRHPDIAALLNTMGTLSWFEGDITNSERFYRRALELAKQILSEGHPNIAVYQRDLTMPLWELGRTPEARELRREALTIGRRILGKNHPEVAWQLNDLANSELEFGKYSEARRLYEEALGVIESRYGPTHLNAATVLHNLALLHARLGDRVEANRRLEQAVEIWTRVLGPSHPYVARALDSIAEVLGDQGRHTEARVLLERALRIREPSLGRDHREVAESLVNLSQSLLRLGDVAEARSRVSRAMRVWETTGSTTELSYTAALALNGELQLRERKYAAARQSFERAISQRETLLGGRHPSVAVTKVGLASAMFGLGRTADALRLALDAEAMNREHLRLTVRYLSEHDSLGYAAVRRGGLDVALSAPGTWGGAAASALLDAVVRSRALILDEMSERHAAIRQTAGREFGGLFSSLVAARQRLANLLVRGTAIGQPASYREMLTDARRQMELAERTLAEHSAEFRAEIARQQVDLEQVRRSLPPGAALVSFVRYNRVAPWQPANPTGPAYAAFVLTSATRTPVFRQLGPATEVDHLVQGWRAEVARGALRTDRRPGASERAYRAAASALRQRIWDPIVPFISSSDLVFIVPDGALNLVSFASLPLGSDRYVAEDGPILHYLPAERDLVAASTDPPTPGKLVAFGGPDFGSIPASAIGAPGWGKVASTCVGLDSITFQPLAKTAQEVYEIERIWATATRTPGKVVTGRDATEQALKQMAAEAGILHLATHGFFLGTDCAAQTSTTRGVGGLTGFGSYGSSVLRLSGVALAGANHRSTSTADANDGILTAEEVASLDLRQARWVVLSACDTGVGEVTAGEGVLGLRRAFRIAGARTLIMSLWSVDDEATRQWMRSLYENRFDRRLDSAASVRTAELAMIRERRTARRSTHPFYWASFVAAGDWR